jgi:NAD(P)-dependent dehydrogenase (short-subunit alcohol dehydrogenase family)
MATSIVIGGTRGMGSIISDHLSDRGDIVYVILSFLTLAKNNKVRKMIENITPLGRMGEADDIANMVEFLCSPKSTFITGNSFFVDGGLSLVGQETIARNLLGCTHEK